MRLRSDATLLARSIRAGKVRPPAPFKLTVAVTYTCEQRCTHCRIWRRPASDELTAGEWRQVWRQGSSTLSWLDLTGGEVTNRPDFSEIAVAALEECPQLALLHFPSNGRSPALLESMTRAILSANPSRLIISLSLDGPPALHDKLRGDKGSYEATLESFQRLRALGVEVYFGFTLSAWNIDHLDETYRALEARIDGFGWSDLHVNFLHESSHFFGNTGIRRSEPEALRTQLRHIIRQRGTPTHPTHLLESLYLSSVESYLHDGRSPLPCSSMSGHAFVNPAGEVYPCHIWDAPVASLREHEYSLARVWDLEVARRRRAEVKSEQCPGCWTPCEAYPTILSNLGEAARAGLFNGVRNIGTSAASPSVASTSADE